MEAIAKLRKDGSYVEIRMNPAKNTPAPFLATVERDHPNGDRDIQMKGCQTTHEANHWISTH